MPSMKMVKERTQGAYSRKRWGERQWEACTSMLFARGYDEDEAVGILGSKWMRFAADASPYTRPVAKDLANFLDDPRNQCTREAVRALREQADG